jgi:hypothetical protein
MAVENQPGQIVYVRDIPGLLWKFGLHSGAGLNCIEEAKLPEPILTVEPFVPSFDDGHGLWNEETYIPGSFV